VTAHITPVRRRPTTQPIANSRPATAVSAAAPTDGRARWLSTVVMTLLCLRYDGQFDLARHDDYSNAVSQCFGEYFLEPHTKLLRTLGRKLDEKNLSRFHVEPLDLRQHGKVIWDLDHAHDTPL
jgi:hypothetical protein